MKKKISFEEELTRACQGSFFLVFSKYQQERKKYWSRKQISLILYEFNY